jgi:hypothetical protein
MPIFTTLGAACAKAWGFTSGLVKDQYFNLVSLLLPGNGTNGAQNNTFLDASTNNFTITRNGNTTQGTFSPFSQTGWGNYFDGTGDYLSVPDNAAFATGTNNFTVEAWVFAPSTAANYAQLCGQRDSAGSANADSPFGIFKNNTGSELTFSYWNGSSSVTATSTIAVFNNSWHHIALVRNGTDLRLYVDGVSSGSLTLSGGFSFANSTTIFSVGRAGAYDGQYWTGYISNFRFVNGTAVYTSAFTPPTSPLTAITNTSLLTCQSNRFVDNSGTPLTITANGNTSVVAFSPFAPTAAYTTAAVGGSGYFDGTRDYLTLPSTSNLAFGTGDFSIEAWVYPTSVVEESIISNATTSGAGDTQLTFYIFNTVKLSGWFTIFLTGSTNVSLNAWSHVVVCRTGTTMSIFLNGIRDATGTVSNNFSSTNAFFVGAYPNVTAGDFNGYITNLRVLKGSSAYDPTQTTITIPTAPPTAVTNTQLLLNFTNAGITDATAKNDLETVGNAQISTAQSKWGGGSMYFDGTGDYLRWTTSNFFNVYQGSNTVEMWIYPTSISSGGSNSSKYGTLFVQQALGSSIQFGLGFNSSGQLVYTYWNGSATVQITSTETLSVNTWSHVGFTYTSSGIALFVNGVYKAPTAITGSPSASATEPMFIGIEGRTAGSEVYYQGYIDDLRVTKGVARYTANFTAPTAPFPVQ